MSSRYKVVDSGKSMSALRRQMLRKLESRRQLTSCVMVPIDFPDSPKVDGWPGYVWVREYGDDVSEFGGVSRVLNQVAQCVVNLPVIVGPAPRAPRQVQVLGVNLASLVYDPGYVGQPWQTQEHGQTHTFLPGRPTVGWSTDIAYVTSRNLMDALVYPDKPASMRAKVAPGWYGYGLTVKFLTGQFTQDFTAEVPGLGLAKLAFVMIDGATNLLAYQYGPTFPWTGWVTTIPPAAYSLIFPEGHVILTAIILYNGMTSITEKCFRGEVRPLLRATGFAETLGGLADVGDGTPTAGNLLEGDGALWQSVGKDTMDLGDFGSGAATLGQVPVATGAGGVAWGAGADAGYYEPVVNDWGDLVLDENNDVVMGFVPL